MSTGYLMLDQPNPHTPQGTYPRRGVSRPSGTCIVHTSQGNWTAGVEPLTRLVRTRTDYGCYHRACDWQDIAVYYPWWWECWQDSETNPWAVGIAAACRTSDWLIMPPEIREGFYRNMARMGADFVRYMRDQWGVAVPLRRLTGAEARARVPGFCAHGDSGVARTDPGADFDWALFFRYIKEDLDGVVPQEEVVTPEQVNEIVHRVNVFAQKSQQDFAAVIINEVRAHTKFNADRILDALKMIPQIPDTFVEELRAELDAELDESLEEISARIASKLEGLSVTLQVPQTPPLTVPEGDPA